MVDSLFWDKLALNISTYLASLPDKNLCNVWVDDIINPEIVEVNKSEFRVIASSYTSEDDGKSFSKYKISITTKSKTLNDFQQSYKVESWQDLEGKLHIVPEKNKIVINAT